MKIKESNLVMAIVVGIMIPFTLLVFVPAFRSIGRTNSTERTFEEVNACEVVSITGVGSHYTIVWERNDEKFITFKIKDSGEETTLEFTK